ncbi:MAG: divalent-cation tolerance protein CutA [Firmicutes bacterium]|nr:divalent-cation tolerance protein CutA [Bacillota bacterium]
MAPAYLVYITTADEEQARRIGRALVERKLAACVNIVPSIRSIYWWQGQMVDEGEALLLVKTLEGALDGIEQTVQELHSYTVPAISAVPVERLHGPYLRWMHEVMGLHDFPGA